MMIELRGVYKQFQNHQLFTDLNLSIKARETVVLFGPSGSGKTVLIKMCLGLIKPDRGEIYLDGERIDNLPEKQLTQIRMKTGTLFQYYALFDSLTVSQNVAFYLANHTDMTEEEINTRVREILIQVNLDGNQHLKPAELSGGMQKRVGIARALVHQPKIIFYDSPTDGLDPVTADRIIDLIKKLDTDLGTTSLVISNDMNTAFRVADRMGMIYNGNILQIGTPGAIAASKDPYVYQFIRGLETGPLLDEMEKITSDND
ncbi:ATP-binding cassette domain-containing protein [bacterium]|nr:ATP-binding cassette domain-containing protein [candidate division CSSED10-310 bacterium]